MLMTSKEPDKSTKRIKRKSMGLVNLVAVIGKISLLKNRFLKLTKFRRLENMNTFQRRIINDLTDGFLMEVKNYKYCFKYKKICEGQFIFSTLFHQSFKIKRIVRIKKYFLPWSIRLIIKRYEE